MNKLIAEEKASDDDAARQKAFAGSRRSAPTTCRRSRIWQADQVPRSADGVNGVEETFDPSFIFRYWLIAE